MSQKSALDKAQTSVASYAMTILAIALFLSIWYHGGGLIWLVPLAWAFSPILAWSILDDELSKELGYSFKEILPTEVSVTTYLLIAEAATILVLLFGGPVLENILAE